jgi:hypothetical protein
VRKKSRLAQGAEGILPFDIEEVPAGEVRVTSYSGLPLVAEMYRACGAAGSVERCVATRQRQRERGLSDVDLVESFALLLASGGDCIDDFVRLQADAGLAEMIGHELPSPTRAKEFLYDFHDDAREPDDRQQRLLTPSFVPGESASLAGLHEALCRTVATMQAQRPADKATIDLDATIIESEKREAAMTYTGESGYQPALAYWAEQEMILADEFRDGNVPAGGLLALLQRAVAALPVGMERLYVRSDSAGYEHELMNWCRAEKPDRAPIIFAISAKMSDELRRQIERLPASAGQTLETKSGVTRAWAEVEFVPSGGPATKGVKPDRYLAIRLKREQGELFGDGSAVKHFAVVTNDWASDGKRLLEWHREKAGTIEKLHDVLKNEFGAGVMPCGRFGANAAWFRLNCLTHNLISLLRQLALPAELQKARPKRLRFHVLCLAGQIIQHARRLLIRVGETISDAKLFRLARQAILKILRTPQPQPSG